jgi:inosine-uridine nucleoside N-ribohydrolase
MKTILGILGITLLLFSGCHQQLKEKDKKSVKIIFDSDFGPDYDDVGALAFLHAMADSGKTEILATISCNKNQLVGPSMEIVNTYFRRPEIPIGAPKTAAVDLGPWQHWSDTLVAAYPHKLVSTSLAPDAIKLYRTILNSQPDTSVTVVTVGFLTNLRDLLQSPPDSISPLNGKDLIAKKVKRLVSMAGKFPEGREFNIYMDSTASKYTFENWPTSIIFSGFEIGNKIKTGLRLIHSEIKNSPVKDVFRLSIPMTKEDKDGRMSWDETAVLIGVYGTDGFFDTIRGQIMVNRDGSNGWKNDPKGKHFYVVQKMPVEEMSRFIEDRMMHVPQK